MKGPSKSSEGNEPFEPLSQEILELKETLQSRIDKMDSALKQAGALAGKEAQRLEEVEKNLRADIAALEAQLKEKEELLQKRETEVKDLWSEMDSLERRKTEMESLIQQAEAAAATKAQQAADIDKNLRADLAALEAQLKEKEEMLRLSEATVRELEEKAPKVQGLEERLRETEETLQSRNAEVGDLKSKMEILMKRLAQMESLFKQAGALVANEAEEIRGASPLPVGSEMEPGKGKAVGAHSQEARVVDRRAASEHASSEVVSSSFFDRMVRALTEAMGPMAPLVVRDQIDALGEALEAFPKARLKELIRGVSREILDQKLKSGFEERMFEAIREANGGVVALEAEFITMGETSDAGLRETLLELNEKSMIDKHEQEKRRTGIGSSSEAEGEDINKIQERMSGEIEKLRAELKEKKILLAKREREEWRQAGGSKPWKGKLKSWTGL